VITVNLRQSSKLMKQYGAPLFNQYIDFLASIVADGQRAGELRQDVSPRIVARGLWGALDGIAMTWALADGEPQTLRRAAKELASIHLDGLRRVETQRT
jgi:TetR/AcrR family transcriptional regulator, fatty acid metabolism regulator protein